LAPRLTKVEVLTEVIARTCVVMSYVGGSKTRIYTNLYSIYTAIHSHVDAYNLLYNMQSVFCVLCPISVLTSQGSWRYSAAVRAWCAMPYRLHMHRLFKSEQH